MTHFSSPGVHLDAPGSGGSEARLTRRAQDFTMKGVHVVGYGQGSRDVSLLLGSRGRAPAGRGP